MKKLVLVIAFAFAICSLSFSQALKSETIVDVKGEVSQVVSYKLYTVEDLFKNPDFDLDVIAFTGWRLKDGGSVSGFAVSKAFYLAKGISFSPGVFVDFKKGEKPNGGLYLGFSFDLNP